MHLHLIPANDDPETLAAVAYGPTVLAGIFPPEGDDGGSGMETPTLDLASLVREEDDDEAGLKFRGRMVGGEEEEEVVLGAFYDAHDVRYVVYWHYEGDFAA